MEDRHNLNPEHSSKFHRNYKKISINTRKTKFLFRKNWYHPNEIGFDTSFFLNVLSGKKISSRQFLFNEIF